MSWKDSAKYPPLPMTRYLRALTALGFDFEIDRDGYIDCCGRLYYPHQEWVAAEEAHQLCRDYKRRHPDTKLTVDDFYAAASDGGPAVASGGNEPS